MVPKMSVEENKTVTPNTTITSVVVHTEIVPVISSPLMSAKAVPPPPIQIKSERQLIVKKQYV